jgi:ribosomal protein S18 acetylase RimI-like enzyme
MFRSRTLAKSISLLGLALFYFLDWAVAGEPIILESFGGPLEGVQLVAMGSPHSAKELAYFTDQICQSYVSSFSSAYSTIQFPDRVLLKNQLFNDCYEDVKDLKDPKENTEFHFVVARRISDQIPVGMATFEIDLITQNVYLSALFVSDTLKGKGLGPRLACSILNLIPSLPEPKDWIQNINLIVLEQNVGAIRLYEKLGFRSSDFQAYSHVQGASYLGKTLNHEAMGFFVKVCNSLQ